MPVVSPQLSRLELIGDATTVQTGEITSVFVTLKTAGGLPISGREVTLLVKPADNLRFDPLSVTDKVGRASFNLISTQPGLRMIAARAGEVELGESLAVILTGDIDFGHEAGEIVELWDIFRKHYNFREIANVIALLAGKDSDQLYLNFAEIICELSFVYLSFKKIFSNSPLAFFFSINIVKSEMASINCLDLIREGK